MDNVSVTVVATNVITGGLVIAFLWRVSDRVDKLAQDVHYLRGRFDSHHDEKEAP